MGGFTTPIKMEGIKMWEHAEELPDGAPTVSNAYLADLLTQQIALTREQNKILRRQHSEWVDGDTAAEMLGKQINSSGTHKRVLTHCEKKGWLKTFGQLRPRIYLRSEVQAILDRVKTGLVLP